MSDSGYKPIGKAPSDEAAGEAWTEIMTIASKHALIVDAYGGVALLAMPDEQRKGGVREQVLRAHLLELDT